MTARVTPINAISDMISGPSDLAVAPQRRVQRELQCERRVLCQSYCNLQVSQVEPAQ